MEYKLIRSSRKTIAIEITRSKEVLVRAPYRTDIKYIESFVCSKEAWINKHLAMVDLENSVPNKPPVSPEHIRFLKAKAKEVLPGKVAHYAKLIGVSYGTITIKQQKTLWGSCSSKGNLNFNCMLMEYPDRVQDYVVVHELCHRKYMDHSDNFWNEVAKVLPDYKQLRKQLKDK